MAMPLVTMSLPVNVFMTALVAKAFPMPKVMIGLISAMPFVGNFLQIFVASFLARWKPPKTLTVMAASLHLLSWVSFSVLLPWVPRDDLGRAAQLFVGWFLISSCFAAIAGVSWNAWIQEWVPGRLRGKFFGRRNGTLQISTLTFMLVSGWVLARWDYSIPAFQLIVVGAVLMRVFSLRWQWQSCHCVSSCRSFFARGRCLFSSRSAQSGRSAPIALDPSTMCSCLSSWTSRPLTSGYF
jgi:hypothetical protein